MAVCSQFPTVIGVSPGVGICAQAGCDPRKDVRKGDVPPLTIKGFHEASARSRGSSPPSGGVIGLMR